LEGGGMSILAKPESPGLDTRRVRNEATSKTQWIASGCRKVADVC